MNERASGFTQHVLPLAMHEKILLRAAELVAMGWIRRTAARDASGQKVRSTAPHATAWCVLGAVDRALYEVLNVDVYAVLGVDVEAYDGPPAASRSCARSGGPSASCSAAPTWRHGTTRSAPTPRRRSGCSGRRPP